MPLIDLNLLVGGSELPPRVRSYLDEAERRIERFRRVHRLPGFIPSDFRQVYLGLRALAASETAPGGRFCEWGSGFGVVAGLAALLGLDACGIEIEPDLVDAARRLAGDFDIPARFVCGSFLPSENGTAGLGTGDGHAKLAPADFDVIFAYPWPEQQGLIDALFEGRAADGAVLVTYHGMDGLRLRRKTRSES